MVAQRIDRAVTRDGRDPGRERAAAIAATGAFVGDQLEEDVVDHRFGVDRVAEGSDGTRDDMKVVVVAAS
jgi:hypothetical protein